MNHQKTAVIYCRVSSKEQVEGTSLGSQERACLEYAQKNNIRILKKYIEQGESAKTANRTEFQKALTFCSTKKNTVDYFIVYKIDRFARNQDDHVTVRAILKRTGTELRSVTEPIDESPMGRAMEGMLSVFAELDNNMRTERVTQGMLTRLQEGVWVWQAPLGYRRAYLSANISLDPSKDYFIRLAFEEYSKGIHTYQSLCNLLNRKGFRTKNGKEISPQLIEKILKNPIYCGWMKVDGKIKGEFKGDFEAIITEELFNSCQPSGMNTPHSKPRTKENILFPLRNVIACSECRKALTGSTSTGSKGKGYSYYHHHVRGCSKAKSWPIEVFEKGFVKYLDEITPSLQYERFFKEAVVDLWKEQFKRIDENNAKIKRRISKLQTSRQKIFDFYTEGKYSDEDFKEQKNLINKEINSQYALIQESREEEFQIEKVLDCCFDFVRNTSKTWIESNHSEKVRFQKLIFKNRVLFDGEKFGTPDLSLIYKINQASQPDYYNLVVPRGVEPLFSG